MIKTTARLHKNTLDVNKRIRSAEQLWGRLENVYVTKLVQTNNILNGYKMDMDRNP